jgi:uncharacterized protein YcnI
MTTTKKLIALGGGLMLALTAMAPLASGHATVSLLQPQGKALTSARAAYVLRAPTERAKQSTIMVTLHVPEAVQTAISVKQLQDWKVVLKKRETGQLDAEGNPRYAIERITWIARNKDSWVEPGFYAEFGIRMQNPATPQRLCFPIDQWYSKKTADGKPEVVRWNGDSASPTPASCLDIVAS